MVFFVFGDESADETKQRVFAISGMVGTDDEWQLAEAAWIENTKGEIFHAAEWEYAGRHEEYKALIQTLTLGPVAGVAYALDLLAFRQMFPNTLREAPYLKCFTRLVKDIAINTAVFIKNETTPVTKIEYTFDNRPEVEFSAARVYSAMVGDREWRESTLLASKLSFESRSNPRIQMADLIAREAMKDLDRQIGPHKHPERKSKIALENSNRFRFFALSRDDLERERSEWVVLERDGFSEAACHEWLRERNMQDTWDNRTRFLEYLDKRALD